MKDAYRIQDHAKFPRTSREAFGHSFYVEKPSRDWIVFVACAVLLVIIAVVTV